jgi:hypothetical protein
MFMLAAGSQFLLKYFIWFTSVTFLFAVIASIVLELTIKSVAVQMATLLVIVAFTSYDLYRNEAGNRRVYALIQLLLSTASRNELEYAEYRLVEENM